MLGMGFDSEMEAAKKNVTHEREGEHTKTQQNKWLWLCKKEMFEKFGEIKGKAKIEILNKDPSRHRPDQDTNADDEENREWKISKEEEKEAEHDRTKLTKSRSAQNHIKTLNNK